MSLISQGTKDVFKTQESKVRSYCRSFDEVFTRASGSKISSSNGDEYIDFLSGCGSLNYGHNDPDMKKSLIEHLSNDGVAHGLDLHTCTKAYFLQSFRDRILQPRNLDHLVQFTGPTGANAVEAAIKLARKITRRTNVIAFTNGFHGVTQGALAATGNGTNRVGPEIPLHGVSRMPFDGYLGPEVDTADFLERMLQDPSSGLDAPAAILLEAVQGEGGLNVASPAWLRRVAQIAKRAGALLIVDEVQTGCGRTGTFFAFEEAGIVPDLVPLAKSLSGFGLPMAVLLIRPEFDVWSPGEHNGTFRGNTHAFVTARVALEKFWSDTSFETGILERALILKEQLTEIAEQIPDARLKGRGMMQGIDVGSGQLADEICHRCFQRGLILETSGPHGEVIKVLASLNIPNELFLQGLGIIAAAVSDGMYAQGRAAE